MRCRTNFNALGGMEERLRGEITSVGRKEADGSPPLKVETPSIASTEDDLYLIKLVVKCQDLPQIRNIYEAF